MTYEYADMYCDPERLIERLNACGQEGWQVASIQQVLYPLSGELRYYMVILTREVSK